MPTNKYPCDSEAWTQITNGEAAALIQLDTNGPIRVRKQITDPDPSDNSGVVMERNKLGTISFDALGGENLFVRGIDSDNEFIVVIT